MVNEDGRAWEKQGADKPKFMEQLLSEPPSQESGQAAGEAFDQGQGGPDEWAGMGVALRGLAPQVDDDGGPAAQAAENSPPAAMFVLVTYDQEDDRRHRRQPSAGDDDPEPSIHRQPRNWAGGVD